MLKLLKKIRESGLEKFNVIHFAGIILVILVFYPMFIKGIMCNDELLLRLWSQKGIKDFFQTTFNIEYIQKGRVLGAIGNLKYMSFFSDNKYIFGLINSAFLFLAIILFGYLTYKIWKNKEFSILLCVLISIFLPINFEFSVPNAYVIVCLEPMIILECSLIFYIDYLDNYNRKKLFVSIGLFLWSMFLYEFLITYVLLFPAIYVIKNLDKKISIKKAIYASIPWVAVSIIYLILYILQGYLFPSIYEGTHLSFNSLSSILNVLKILFVAVFPTYFSYFNDKYNYLFERYNSGNVKFENVFNPLIIIFGLSLFVLLYILLSKTKIIEKKKFLDLKEILILAVAIVYGILPALPNALTPMYQEGVTVESFTWISVSIYLYFAVMFFLTFILFRIVTYFKFKWLSWICILVIIVSSVGVQIRNHVFVKEQVSNYDRIVAIENVIKLDYWKQYGTISVFAPSLYETMNSMAIEKEHWSQYAKIYNNDLYFEDEYNTAQNAVLVVQENNDFYFYYDNVQLLISKEKKGGEISVKDVEGNYRIVKVEDSIWDEGDYSVCLLSSVK